MIMRSILFSIFGNILFFFSIILWGWLWHFDDTPKRKLIYIKKNQVQSWELQRIEREIISIYIFPWWTETRSPYVSCFLLWSFVFSWILFGRLKATTREKITCETKCYKFTKYLTQNILFFCPYETKFNSNQLDRDMWLKRNTNSLILIQNTI